MAFDGQRVLIQTAGADVQVAERRDDFRRLERLVILTGGAAIGACTGFVAAMSFGPMPAWQLIVIAAPLMVLALYLLAQTLKEGIKRNAYGCITAAVLHAASLLAWPMAALFAPVSAVAFWAAPVAALATLVLFASCWKGAPLAIYRLGLQGALVAAIATHQGLLLTLGN